MGDDDKSDRRGEGIWNGSKQIVIMSERLKRSLPSSIRANDDEDSGVREGHGVGATQYSIMRYIASCESC